MSKKKGQIIVLDVLFAVVLLIFLFFIVSKLAEVKIYENISDARAEELEEIGSLVYDRLVNNPLINCYVADSNNYYLLRSCIAEDSEIKKEYLGMPDNYKCKVTFDSLSVMPNECSDDDTDVEEYFYIKQNIFTNNERQINKAFHKQKVLGTSSYASEEMTIKVWRDE